MQRRSSAAITRNVTMKIKTLCLASVFALSGCATCQQHPVWCAVGAAIVVGTAAAVIEHHHDQTHERQIAPNNGFNPLCAPYCPIG
jgi:hypothetical protein